MNVFVDNTGFHSVGRCLDGNGLGDVDVRGLLQFGIQLIFSESILVSGFEIESIKERTQAVRGQLIKLGVGAQNVRIVSYRPLVYAKACRDAAQRFADEMDLVFSPRAKIPHTVLRAAKPDLLPHDRELYSLVHRVVTSRCTSRDLDWVTDPKQVGHAAPSIGHMLVTNPSLLQKIRRLASAPAWSLASTEKLVAVLRYYANEDLGKRKQSLYSPAIARAVMVRKASDVLVARLSTALEEATSYAVPQSLGIPSVAAALLVEGRGEPNGVIEKAIDLRDRAGKLRAFLSRKLAKYQPGSRDWFEEVRIQVADLSIALRQEVAPYIRPHWPDCIQLHAGFPFATFDVKSIREWWKFHQTRKYLSVLTEMSKILRHDLNAEPAFGKLIQKSQHRRSAGHVG